MKSLKVSAKQVGWRRFHRTLGELSWGKRCRGVSELPVKARTHAKRGLLLLAIDATPHEPALSRIKANHALAPQAWASATASVIDSNILLVLIQNGMPGTRHTVFDTPHYYGQCDSRYRLDQSHRDQLHQNTRCAGNGEIQRIPSKLSEAV